MIENIKKTECTGCKMCADICPNLAITFEVDEKGFWYPHVDYNKCTKCGACTNTCPSLNKERVPEMCSPEVVAAWSKDDDVRLSSTSGGVFYEIGNFFLEIGGAVAGCKYTDDWKGAEHFIAHSKEELLQVKGSKYFQSDTAGIYKAVKEELKKGKPLLFCGTPCQNAALRSFLKKEYDNLYYMDFICRNINSPLAFKKYIEGLEKEYDSEVVEVHLKNKKYGWQSLASQVRFANGKESIRDRNTDFWVRGFIYNDLYTRDVCFHCKYRKLPRLAADITIGDFWGILGQTQDDMFKGISVVLLNSNKGRQLFENVKERFEIQNHSINSVLPGNPALLTNPVEAPEKRNKFFELIKTAPFSTAVGKCINVSSIDNIKKKARRQLSRIKSLYRVATDPGISFYKYIYYNYFCKNIIRKGTAKVIPYKNAILDLDKNARIFLFGDRDLKIGTNKLKGSKSETHLRMYANAVWNAYHGCQLFYNTVLEIKSGAVFDTGFFSANSGSVIIVDKRISFGEDVMIGRNVIIYDSDFHQLRDSSNNMINPASPVIIEDHVWLTSNIAVLKGVTIGRDSLVASTTVINRDVPAHCFVSGKSPGKVVKDEVNWSRESTRESH